MRGGEALVISGRRLTPEQRLLLAVLDNAVATLQRSAFVGDAHRRFLEVESWLDSDDVEHPFSFVSICDVLGMDIGRVRFGLLAWREKGRATLAARRCVPGTAAPAGADRDDRIAP
jgi:hypothetical protein